MRQATINNQQSTGRKDVHGTMLTASLRRSQFNCPGKRKQQVVPQMAAAIRWLRSYRAKKS